MTDEDDNVPGEEPEGAEADDVEEAAASEEEENGEDAAAEDADGAEGEGDEEDPKPKKPRGGFQRRISQLTADRRQAERDRDYWREMAIRGQPQQQETKPDSQPPKQEDFQDYTAYLDARAEWVADQKVAQALQKEREGYRKQQSEQRQRQAAQTYESKLDEARAKYEDFDDVAFAEDVHITNQMATAIMESDMGPEIQYHLGTNPAEAQRIARLSPVRQLTEIGKLEAKLSAPPPPKKSTQAPAPVKPVAGRGSAPSTKNPDDLPIDEWMKRANAGTLKY